MTSRSLRASVKSGVAVIVIALAIPAAVRAECVAVRLPKGVKKPPSAPTLAFSGIVTATDFPNYTVSFRVDRVWKGELKRDTTLLVLPLMEGVGVRAFETGEQYFVLSFLPTTILGKEEAEATGLPAGALQVMFGCAGGPVPPDEASEWLRVLGRGWPPRP